MASFSPALKYINKLQGQRVLVLGGSTGMGFAVAEAALEYGAHVFVSSSNQSKIDAAVEKLEKHIDEVGLKGVSVAGKTCDLSNEETMEENIVALLKEATKEGKLDHVVFTAGNIPKVNGVKDITLADIHAMGTVRRVGTVMLAKHLPDYINPGRRSSLTLTTGTNSTRPGRGWSVMAGESSATEGLARGLAVDLKPLRVNCVQPGAVYTELFSGISEERLPAVLKHYEKEAILEAVGSPSELAEAYLYCMRDTFATGALVRSDGGRLVGDSKDQVQFK